MTNIKTRSMFRSHQQNLKLQWKRLMESKRIYETRCRDEVACNQFYHQEISRLGKSSKEAEKVKHFEAQYLELIWVTIIFFE